MLGLFASSIHMTIRALAERYIMPEDVLPEVKRISQQQHRLIYEAISDQDEALAAIRMREHLQLSYGVYKQATPRGGLGSTGKQPPARDAHSGTTRINPRLW
jgi:DNA-binding FadR family transcriptional regulator